MHNKAPLQSKDYDENDDIKPDTWEDCNNCIHNRESIISWNCIKCSGFDRYEKARD